jgi:hypothetical protein
VAFLPLILRNALGDRLLTEVSIPEIQPVTNVLSGHG